MKKNAKAILPALIAAVVMILMDQWTKMAAVAHLKDQAPFVIWDGVFEFQYTVNEGAAFSILQQQQVFFYIMTACVILGVMWLYLFRIPSGGKYKALNMVAVTLVAGAVGNLIDRARLHYVIDFIYFKLIDFPIFNVADIFVTCSCIVLCLLLLFYYKEEDLANIL